MDFVKKKYLMINWGYISLVLHKNIHCGYPLEVSQRGTSN